MQPIDRVRDELVQLWGRLGPFWGISPTTARVLAWLLASARPLDGEELAQGLGISRGAASMAVRELADWGLVHPERAAGSRRITYRPEADLERAIRSIVQTRKRREWDPLLERVRAWSAGLADDDSEDAATLRARLGDVEAVIGLVDRMAESFLKGGVLQRFGLKAIVATARSHRERKPR